MGPIPPLPRMRLLMGTPGTLIHHIKTAYSGCRPHDSIARAGGPVGSYAYEILRADWSHVP
jgi:hypothetical protein